MRLTGILVCCGLTGGVLASESTLPPDCAAKCWENSRYVSSCMTDTTCYCEDVEFQSVVLQCLYSQCQTSHFGAALHHTLEACSPDDLGIDGLMPPLIRQQGLRKRTNEGSPVSARLRLALPSGIHSVQPQQRFVVHSAFVAPKPTRSVGSIATFTYKPFPTSANTTISHNSTGL